MHRQSPSRSVRITTLEPLILMSVCVEGAEITESELDISPQSGDLPIGSDSGDDPLISTRGEDSIVASGDAAELLPGADRLTSNDGEWSVVAEADESDREFRSIDGTNNNPEDPTSGSTNERLIRIADNQYSDGVSSPAGEGRPNPRDISNVLVRQVSDIPGSYGLSDLTWVWGQFLDHDIDLTEPAEPHEPFNISVPQGDEHFDPAGTGAAEIELNRSTFDPTTGTDAESPREQVNQITAFIDGSMVYGSDQERADALRTFEDGMLRVSDGDLLPYNVNGLPNAGGPQATLFLAGDVRANENALLTSMHTIWVREHNRLAAEIGQEDPCLTDEQIYQRARELVIAQIQAITYNEFLPALLGQCALPDWYGYDSAVDPQIANEFSTAAFRFGHTMLTSELLRLDPDGSPSEEGPLRLQDAFFRPTHVQQYGIDSLLQGAAAKGASEVDSMLIDDVRNFLFGPPGSGGLDLASLNIQRGRDHGLADYNSTRVALGLSPVSSFAQITTDEEVQQKLAALYESVDNIDLWVGGLAEDHVAGSSMGETFRTILADQFSRLRDGDRFWYEASLSADLIDRVNSTTLADVIERNSDVSGLQGNVFFVS